MQVAIFVQYVATIVCCGCVCTCMSVSVCMLCWIKRDREGEHDDMCERELQNINMHCLKGLRPVTITLTAKYILSYLHILHAVTVKFHGVASS